MTKVGIVGGTGYTGAELLRLLVRHPHVKIELITSRTEAGLPVAQVFPNLRSFCDLTFSSPDTEALLACDIVFFATPHGIAQTMVPDLISGGVRVVDLSADFRIKDIDTWEKWYGQKHECPELVEMAVYGLPEVNRQAIKSAQLVACAGCYPTSVQLGFLPLLESDVVDTNHLIANSASGISGAGRQAKINLLLAEAADSFKAYSVAGHRHLPEIEQGLRSLQPVSAECARVTFVPHLLPAIRGIHSTLYATLRGSDPGVQALYEERFANEPFVDVLPEGVPAETRSVRGSNVCRISIVQPQGRSTLVIASVIDNLTKGASGQGVQNMNIMLGIDECSGLDNPSIFP